MSKAENGCLMKMVEIWRLVERFIPLSHSLNDIQSSIGKGGSLYLRSIALRHHFPHWLSDS